MENQLSTKIKALRFDRGHEYLSKQFKSCYDENGVFRQPSISYTSQQNGIAERRNMTC